MNFTPQINFTDWNPAYPFAFIYTKLTAKYTALGAEQFITIGNFDWQNDFKLFEFLNYAKPNTLPVGYSSNYYFLDNITLVEDTTQPMISLSYFSLGNDTALSPGQSFVAGGDPNFFSYKWSTGDPSRFITISQPGLYWCRVYYRCNVYTDTLYVTTPNAISQTASDRFSIVQVYPNPSHKGVFHFKWRDNLMQKKPLLQIWDVFGRLVF